MVLTRTTVLNHARLVLGVVFLWCVPATAQADWYCNSLHEGPAVSKGCGETRALASKQACLNSSGKTFTAANGDPVVSLGQVPNYSQTQCDLRVEHTGTGGSWYSWEPTYPRDRFCPDGSFRKADYSCDCPEGQTWDAAAEMCVNDVCPDGNTPNEAGECPGNCFLPAGTKKGMGWQAGTYQPSPCVDFCEYVESGGVGVDLSGGYRYRMYRTTGASCGYYDGNTPNCDSSCDAPDQISEPPIETDHGGVTDNGDGTGTAKGPAPPKDFPREPGCSVDSNGNVKCYNGGDPSGPTAGDSGGPDAGINPGGGSGNPYTVDSPGDGIGKLPPGTPFDADNDGNMDSVIGNDGKAYPDANGDGKPDVGSDPIVDPTNVNNNGGGEQCKDDPSTTKNECDSYTPPGDCVEDYSTAVKECDGAGNECVDNPDTLANECMPGGGDCTDDPSTQVDECGPGGGDGDGPGSGECTDDPETEENECGPGDEKVGLGGCEQQPTCEGDVMQCAIIQLQWETACAYYVSDTQKNSGESLFDEQEADSGEFLWTDVTDIEGFPELGFDGQIPAGGACPPPLELNLSFGSFAIPFAPLCPLFDIAGIIVFIGSLIAGVRIIMAGSFS